MKYTLTKKVATDKVVGVEYLSKIVSTHRRDGCDVPKTDFLQNTTMLACTAIRNTVL